MALMAVVGKEFRMFFRYPLRVVSSLIVGLVFLLQFIYFGQAVLGGRYSALLQSSTGVGDYPTYALIGYVLWWVSVSPMEASVWGVRRELQRDTLESNVVSPMSLVEMILALSLSWMLMDSVIMAIVFVMGTVIFEIPLSGAVVVKSLPVIGLSFLAFLGFGLVFAGLVMVLKNIGPFAQIFEFLILFLSGAFFPLSTLPEWVVDLSKALPLTHAASAVRKVFVGMPYSAIKGEIAWLLILLPLYWAVSYLSFRWAEKTSRMIGYGGY
ncbi:ABC transporter permease [Thermococcus sp. Bubb.Bath]|uniref:ABC transporter permease n=1 Tax=Thermococcus sp. Bubb.Bath TaxID=1638242 RepID=UPI00143B1D45|nr:ABC transporter permease [Thermococcus sp. Bubb.Bath]NJF25867.1 ABC transporter permease [Thermococcus sp. Bubb.Bath]